MSEQIGQWRASYAPGKWIVLGGPTSLVIMQPAPARVSAMISGFWEVVLQADSLDRLVGELAKYNVERMPDFAAFFWSDGEMRSLVRGGLDVVDVDSGDVVARGRGVQTWTETGLGHIRRVRVEMEDADTADLLKLPLVVGAATACVVHLDATEQARITSPQPMPAPAAASLTPLTFEPVAPVVPVPVVPAGAPADVPATRASTAASSAAVASAAAASAAGASDNESARTELLLPSDLPDFDEPPRRGHDDAEDAQPLPFHSDDPPSGPDEAQPERGRFLNPGSGPDEQPAGPDANGAPETGAEPAAVVADDRGVGPFTTPPGDPNPFGGGSPFDREYAGQPGDPALAGAGRFGAASADPFAPHEPDLGGNPDAFHSVGPGPGPGHQPGPPGPGNAGFGLPPAQPAPVGGAVGAFGGMAGGVPAAGAPGVPGAPGAPGVPGGVGAPNGPGAAGPRFGGPQAEFQAGAPAYQGDFPPQVGPGPDGPFGQLGSQPSPFAPPQPSNEWPPQQSQSPSDLQNRNQPNPLPPNPLPSAEPGPDLGGDDQGQLLGLVCALNHANPPDAQRCRRCGGPLQGQPHVMPQPVLGQLRPSNGNPIDVDRTVLIGRSPQANQVAREQLPRLLTVQSPSHDISRTHLQVTPEGWELVATDLHSTNGTFLIRPGQPEPERMPPGEPVRVFPGCLIDLGDGVTILVDHPA